MHPDARITLYGGVGICLALCTLAVFTHPDFARLGFGINTGALAVAVVFDLLAQ